MAQTQIIHPSELTPEDVAAWRALCTALPTQRSPLMGPDFTQLVGAFRPDARVAVWRAPDGTASAFLPHHRRGNAAFPIGAPLSDYHGPVARPGFHLAAALPRASLQSYRATALLADTPIGALPTRDGFLIELGDGPEAYLEALRQDRPKNFKNLRRLGHKLEREIGPLRIETTPDAEAFETLVTWKRQQLARTGGYDFLRTAWVAALMRHLLAQPDPAFGGLLVSLYAGDRLVAGHFGLQAGEIYHPWLASTDPELGDYGLGHVFLMQAITAMPALGLSTYDLGPGHEHYKRLYARSTRQVGVGDIGFGATAANEAGFVGRLRRRLEVISIAETTALGRAQGYAETAAAAARRFLPSKDAA